MEYEKREGNARDERVWIPVFAGMTEEVTAHMVYLSRCKLRGEPLNGAPAGPLGGLTAGACARIGWEEARRVLAVLVGSSVFSFAKNGCGGILSVLTLLATQMKKIILSSFFALVGVLSFAFSGSVVHADWSALNSSTTKEFSGISCPDARTCILVSGIYLSGGSGGILKTTDGGETFTTQNSPTLNPLHAVSCSSTATCYATGDFGTLLKTSNGGESWIEIDIGSKSNTPRFTNVFAVDDRIVLVVGRDGILFRSEDGGGSWGRPTIKSVSDFYAIYFSDKKNGFIGGDDGALFSTDDGGATWTYQSSLRLAGQIVSIHGDGKQSVFAVGDSLSTSADGGKTWSFQKSTAKRYSTVRVVTDKLAYYIGDLNLI